MAKILERYAQLVDKTVETLGDEMSAKDFAQIMSRVLSAARCEHVGLGCIFAEMQTLEKCTQFTGFFEAELILLQKDVEPFG